MDKKIFQLNCQRSYAVMCEVGALMHESGSSIALVQEPYTTNGCIRGLPASMRVFIDTRANAAILINDARLECMLIRADDYGVCVCVEGEIGRIWVASIYCKFGENLDPYIAYMDTVLLQASNTPVILGMDANASSTLWFSKISRQASGYQSLSRGEVLSEWRISNRVHILNEPSEWYTFDGPRGKSDIDVTLVNEAAKRTFEISWKVMGGTGVSDHNPIELMNSLMSSHGASVVLIGISMAVKLRR